MSASIPPPADDRYRRVAAFAEDAAFIAIGIVGISIAIALVVLALAL